MPSSGIHQDRYNHLWFGRTTIYSRSSHLYINKKIIKAYIHAVSVVCERAQQHLEELYNSICETGQQHLLPIRRYLGTVSIGESGGRRFHDKVAGDSGGLKSKKCISRGISGFLCFYRFQRLRRAITNSSDSCTELKCG